MHDQAVRVERDWGKPIMSSLHAFFSVGLLAGPAVIGWFSHLTGLSAALYPPLVLCAAGAFLARSATPLVPHVRSQVDQS